VIDTQLRAVWIVLQVLAGRSLASELRKVRYAVQDNSGGALQDICFGVFRHLGLLRGLVAALATRAVTDRDIEALLLVALYQLQFTRAAPYAVVDHAVRACIRLRKNSAKGLVNALLRNFLRRPEALLSQARRTEEGRWSYPQWWIDELRRAYPARHGAILEAGSARPPMTLRVNLRLICCADYLALLRDASISAEQIGRAALLLAEPMSVEQLPGFAQGLVSVQDLSAQYAAALLDLAVGQTVLDACAAPGGKTAHILESADVELTAIDRDGARLARVRETLERLSLRARVVCADAAEPSSWWDGMPFQRILLDAPCTASGIVRRHPDIKWLRRPQDGPALAAQQRRLLEVLWHMLAAGGKLLYATCSVFPDENQLQIAAFLQSHPEARLLPLSDIPDGPEIGNIKGQILPDSRHDGFFYALLQRA
jgi:16S rRNA (cytosine967-C5)-methyltransferase